MLAFRMIIYVNKILFVWWVNNNHISPGPINHCRNLGANQNRFSISKNGELT